MRPSKIILLLLSLIILSCKKTHPIQPATYNNWKVIHLNYTGNTTDITFKGPDTGFIVGDDVYNSGSSHFTTALLRSVDGGETWQAGQFKIPDVSIKGIYAAADGILYAGGQSFTPPNTYRQRIYKSSNSGDSWELIDTMHMLTSDAFTLFDKNRGILCVNNSIFETLDGGASYSMTYHGTGYAAIYRMQFLNQITGYAYGGFAADGSSAGVLVKTTSGGDNWSTLTGNFNDILSLYFLDANRGYMFDYSEVGDINHISSRTVRLLQTTDGGNSWTSINDKIYESYGIPAGKCYFLNEQTGYFATSGKIYVSHDGGKTWDIDYDASQITNANNVLTGLYFNSYNETFAISSGGLLLKKIN